MNVVNLFVIMTKNETAKSLLISLHVFIEKYNLSGNAMFDNFEISTLYFLIDGLEVIGYYITR